MKTRIISGTVLGVITIAAGLAGGVFVGIALLFCSLIGYAELIRAFPAEGGRPAGGFGPAECAGFAVTALYYLLLVFGGSFAEADILAAGAAVLLIIVLMAIFVFTFPRYQAGRIAAVFFSFVYCPVMMSFIYRARMLPHGEYVYALVFFCTWICDTCAYFTGRALGKHKLAPVLSPKKTIEGSIGGVVGSAVFSMLLAVVLVSRYDEAPGSYIAAFALIGLVGGAVSEVGDLAASAIKRCYNIKDYGRLIPGHGGIMDRFDSVIFTAPLIYALAAAFLMR